MKVDCKADVQRGNLPPEEWTHWSAEVQQNSADVIRAQQIDLCLEQSASISWSLASFTGVNLCLQYKLCSGIAIPGPESRYWSSSLNCGPTDASNVSITWRGMIKSRKLTFQESLVHGVLFGTVDLRLHVGFEFIGGRSQGKTEFKTLLDPASKPSQNAFIAGQYEVSQASLQAPAKLEVLWHNLASLSKAMTHIMYGGN